MIPITIKPDGEIGVDLKEIVKSSLAVVLKVHNDLKHRQFIKMLTRLGVENTLFKIIHYLHEDRLTEGIGVGGWSKTASAYVELIYGREAANGIYESMTDTALAIEAIKSFERLIKRSHKDYEFQTLDESLQKYLTERWNSRRGDAGAFKSGMDGFQLMPHHVRHTAMIVRVFGQIPELRRNLGTTADYLSKRVLEMDATDWKKEKIATPIAVYVAVKYFEKQGNYLSAETIYKMKQIAIDEAISGYDARLKGWHSGDFKQVALPFYSLYLLAEMPEIWMSDSVLRRQMEESLKSLLGLVIRSSHGLGFPVHGKTYPDIGLSSLMISALLQKPNRTGLENETLSELIEFVVKSIDSGAQHYWTNTYAWSVSYFVRDICNALSYDKDNKKYV